jgi:hypothetical protein
MDDELDGVITTSLDAVPRITRESPMLATTMDNAVQSFWTDSKRRLRRSLSYTTAHAAT